MVIGIDASQANTHERTGTEWYAFHLIQEWARNNSFGNNKVIVYTRDGLVADFPKLPPHWHVRTLKWPPKIFWSQLRLSIEMLLHPVDLLFIPSHAIPLIHPKNTATTIHDIGFEHAQHVYATKSVVRIQSQIVQGIINVFVRCITLGRYGSNELDYHRFSVRFALKHAKTLFTVSEFSKKEIQQVFGTRNDIVVACNGIDSEQFFSPFPESRISEISSKYHLRRPYMLSIGRIEKKKNSHEVLAAYLAYRATHPHTELDLVFAGGIGYGGEAVQQQAAHQDREHIHFLGFTPQEDLPALLAGADLFIFLSEYEGFGVPLMQALAVQTPVLASDLEVFHEIAGNFITYCNPHKTSEVIGGIKKALTKKEPRLYAQASQHAHSFTWKKTATRIANHLLKTLANNA